METDDEDKYDGQTSTQSVSQIYQDSLIKRAPDKMIDYVQGFILLAYRNSIIYLNVQKFTSQESEEDD